MPAALVHLDEVKISEHPAIISQTKLRTHLSEDPSLIIVPASLANKTVVNQNLLLRQLPTIGVSVSNRIDELLSVSITRPGRKS
jgi:hypothetical protein